MSSFLGESSIDGFNLPGMGQDSAVYSMAKAGDDDVDDEIRMVDD